MEIRTGDDGGWWKVVMVLGVVACLVIGGAVLAWSGRLSLHAGVSPEEEARAEVMRSVAVTATAQAIRQAEELHQINKARLEEELAWQKIAMARWETVKTVGRGLAIGLMIGTLMVAAGAGGLGMYTAYGQARKQRWVPVVKVVRVGVGLVALSSSADGGKVTIIDELTGRQNRIELPAGEDILRAKALVEMVQSGKPVEILLGSAPVVQASEMVIMDKEER